MYLERNRTKALEHIVTKYQFILLKMFHVNYVGVRSRSSGKFERANWGLETKLSRDVMILFLWQGGGWVRIYHIMSIFTLMHVSKNGGKCDIF